MTPSEKKKKNKENVTTAKQSPSIATALTMGLKRFSTNKIGGLTLGLGLGSG